MNIFLLLHVQGIVLCALIQEVNFFSHYTPHWSHHHKCSSLAAVTFAEYFYAKAREGVPQRLLPLANCLILYLRCHTIGSLPHSQMVCHTKRRNWIPPKGLIPLMAVLQQHKSKVRPVMDFRQLNCYVDVFTANKDVKPAIRIREHLARFRLEC